LVKLTQSHQFILRNVAYEKLNLTISLHRKQIFNVFYFKKRTENKKNKKRDKNKKRKKTFFTSMLKTAGIELIL